MGLVSDFGGTQSPWACSALPVLGFMLCWVVILGFLTRSCAFSFCSRPHQLQNWSQEKIIRMDLRAYYGSSIQVAGLGLEPRLCGCRTPGLDLPHIAR